LGQNGGARPGAGRPKGAKTQPRVYEALRDEALDGAVSDVDIDIAAMARGYGPMALGVLSAIASKSQSDTAKVAAANSLLDRGFGKPSQSHTLETKHDDQAVLGR
jgi:hypothetical protein